MIEGTDYEFEWDDAKAKSNLAKHGVNFMDAMSVLLDPLAMTRFDDPHSDDEPRWVSLGRAAITISYCWLCIRSTPAG